MIDAARMARSYYHLLADSTHDREARVFLEGLVVREKAHAEALEVLALEMTDRALPPFPDRFLDCAQISSDWQFVEGISYGQAIDIAADAAAHSALLYGALADGSSEPVRALLANVAELQEAHAEQLLALRESPHGSSWSFRQVARTDLPQGLRNAIAAEQAAAHFHTLMRSHATTRVARIFLEQLALDEEATAEAVEILVLESCPWTLPATAEPHARTIKLPASVPLPREISLATALEHALFAQTLGARYYRVLVGLADDTIAPGLESIAHDQEEHLAKLIGRRNTYWRTEADDVPTMDPAALQRLLREHNK
jgi:rubrerythrin